LQGTLPAGCRPAAYTCGIAFVELMSGRAEAPGCDSHPGARAWPWRQQCVAGFFTRGLPPCGLFVWHRVCRADERSGGSPRLRFAPWCARLVVASAVRWQGSLPAGCRPAAYVWRKPPVAIRTLVRAPGRGVSSALAGHFTRGLPPCGLCVAEAPGCVSYVGARAWSWRRQCVGRALYPRAAALRLMCGGSPGLCFVRWCARQAVASAVRWQGTLPAGCRPAAYVWRKPRVVFGTLVRPPH
jgi:hypothetical protein